jgi:hypothetical protein
MQATKVKAADLRPYDRLMAAGNPEILSVQSDANSVVVDLSNRKQITYKPNETVGIVSDVREPYFVKVSAA